MPHESEWISTSFVEHLLNVAAEFGIPIDRRLEAQLEPRWSVANPDGHVAIGPHDELWQIIAREAGVNAFAETAASVCTPASVGLVGHLVGSCSNLREAADVLDRYGHLAGPSYVAPRMRVLDGNAAMVFRVPPALSSARERGDVSMLSLLKLMAALAEDQGSCAPSQIHLQHKDPKNEEWYARHFACPVRFGCEETAFVFSFGPPSLDEIALRRPYGDLITYLRRQIAALPAAPFDPPSYSELVREVVSRSLHLGKGRLTDTASSLGTSERTLQRYLRSEGYTFEQILDLARRELATGYLRSSNLSVGEIARLVGYGDASQFTRAFRRWQPGLSPAAYRQRRRLQQA